MKSARVAPTARRVDRLVASALLRLGGFHRVVGTPLRAASECRVNPRVEIVSPTKISASTSISICFTSARLSTEGQTSND
jgi:hypothetical protein